MTNDSVAVIGLRQAIFPRIDGNGFPSAILLPLTHDRTSRLLSIRDTNGVQPHGKQGIHFVEKDPVVCFDGSGAAGRKDFANAFNEALVHHSPFPVTIFASVRIRKVNEYLLNLVVVHHGGNGQIHVTMKQNEVGKVHASREISFCYLTANLHADEEYVGTALRQTCKKLSFPAAEVQPNVSLSMVTIPSEPALR